ncbi:MAG: hypothetical protein FVQ79_05820 [Planctomycetes bacterium]|nr:hypothetical protein [Planctomycetota bacterium]
MAGRIPRVVVVGPSYVDMTLKCQEIPCSGDIVEGSAFSFSPTGSGPNSAIEASLCGCEVDLITKVGDDVLGGLIRDGLGRHGVRTDFVYTAQAISTGVSVTMVNSLGENTVCVSHGANRALVSEDIGYASVEQLISMADICLIRGDLPPETVKMAIKTASLYKTKVALEISMDIQAISEIKSFECPGEYYLVDILMPNLRSSVIAAESVAGFTHKLKFVGSELVARGIECVVLTTGTHGYFLFDRDGVTSFPSFESEHVFNESCSDDAFAGAFTASLGAGDTAREAVKFAAAAVAVASSKCSSQDTMPTKDEIIELLQRKSD